MTPGGAPSTWTLVAAGWAGTFLIYPSLPLRLILMPEDIAVGTRVVEVELPNGATALVRAREFEGGGARKVGWEDRFDFKGVAETLEGVADALRTSLAKARPSKVTVELGVELAVKSGKLIGLIVEGEGGGSFTVTLEWGGEQPASE